MNGKAQYVRKMQAKLDEWNAEIDALATRAGRATAELKIEYAEQIEALKAKQTVARQKLAEMQQAGESAWEDLKAGIETAWNAMGEAVDSARSRFR
jgi:hypothetical protein